MAKSRCWAGGGIGTLALAASLSACGSGDGDHSLQPARPTTTAVGGFGLTETQRDFHLSFRIERAGANLRVLDVQALTSPNIEQLGAVTVWPKDLPGKNMGFGPNYPPADAKAVHALSEEIPAAETVVVPKPFTMPPAVYVVTGFRLKDGDIGAVNGVRVTYEADGNRTSDTWTVAAIACEKQMMCMGTAGSDDPDFESRVLGDAGLLPKD
jgi:hypothetical protein